MKNILLLAVLLIVQNASAQYNLPVTFDNPDVTYTLTDFGGNSSSVIEDPNNAGNNIVQVTKITGAETWAGTTIGGAVSFTASVPFSEIRTKMSIRVWSPDAGIPVRFKLEDAKNNGITVETEAMTTVTDGWETLVFDFANEAPGTAALVIGNTYDKASVFFNFGSIGEEKTYFFDDVSVLPPDILFPVHFENPDINWAEAFTGFDGGSAEVIDNPDKTEANMSDKVVKMVKNAGAVWAGAFLKLSKPIDLEKGTMFSMNVWAPSAETKVLFKFENPANAGENFEKQMVVGVANAWTKVDFDFSEANKAFPFQNVVVIFDNGTAGDGSAAFTYYFDDMMQHGSMPPMKAQIMLPVHFEDSAKVDYTMTDFGGAASEYMQDPTNEMNHVMKVTKTAGAETWAGTTIGTDKGFVHPVPFKQDSTFMNVRVWSATAGVPVRLKLEDAANNQHTVETQVMTTKAGEWEVLNFDFSMQAEGTQALNLEFVFNKATIFFNFGTVGADDMYYFDDVRFGKFEGEPVLPEMTFPVHFENQGVDWTQAFTPFDGGHMEVIDNPDKTEANMSDKVVKMVKDGGQPWGGAYFSMTKPIDMEVSTDFSVKVWAPSDATKILLKFENPANASENFEKEMVVGVANAWTSVNFDMSEANKEFAYQNVVLIFDLGTIGDGTAASTYYFDDVDNKITTSAESDALAAIPTEISLNQNYPNPFNPSTTIAFGLNASTTVNLEVYDALGRRVGVLINNRSMNPGNHSFTFDASRLSTGMYLYRMQTSNGFTSVKTMMLVK